MSNWKILIIDCEEKSFEVLEESFTELEASEFVREWSIVNCGFVAVAISRSNAELILGAAA